MYFYGGFYGIPHDHINPKKDILDYMLKLRKQYVEGIRHDYIDDPDVIGMDLCNRTCSYTH